MKIFLTLICFSLLVFSCSKEKSTFESRPKVLFITVDDMNGWGLMKDYTLTKALLNLSK